MTNHLDAPTITDALRWLGESGIEVQQWTAHERGDTVTVLALTTGQTLATGQTWMNLEFRLDGRVYSYFPPVIDGLPAQSGEYAQRLGYWRIDER